MLTTAFSNPTQEPYRARLSCLGAAFLAGVLTAAPSHAQVYKWVDEQGRVHFTDRPTENQNARPVEIGPINSYTADPVFSELKSTPGNAGRAKKVVMYGAQWCGVCKRAKSYFEENRIPFVEYDVETSAKGRRDYKRLKGKGVPIILVGKRRMDGFSISGLQAMLTP